FNVNRFTRRRSVLFLAHRDFRTLDALHCLANLVEIYARRLAVALGELHKGNRYFAEVRTCLTTLIERILTRANRNVGNHGLNKRVVFTQCLHDTIFNDSRYGIRYHLVCTNRHADKRVDKVWIAVREEHDRRLPDRSEYDREDEEQEHTTENSRRPPSFKAPA